MAFIGKLEFELLLHHSEPHSLSLLLPAAGTDARKGHIRLKSLLKKARGELLLSGLPKAEVTRRLAIVQKLFTEDFFRQPSGESLTLFVGRNRSWKFLIPLDLDELAIVSNRFYLKPLFPLLDGQKHFYILALSQNAARLFQGNAFGLQPVAFNGVPASLGEVMAGYTAAHLQPDDHPAPLSGPSANIYHDSGTVLKGGQHQHYLEEYCQLIVRALQERLLHENAPLVLAASKPLDFIFRLANTYRQLLSPGISGNPDYLTPKELHQQALKIDELLLNQTRLQALARYEEMAGLGRAADDYQQIVRNASRGQVDTLFVSLQDHIWGSFQPQDARWEIHDTRLPGDEDLLDHAAVSTFLAGGTVYAMDRSQIPKGRPLAATLRYAPPKTE